MALAIAWSAVSGHHRAVYPIAGAEITAPPFPIPPPWPRAYGLELGPGSAHAIWGAYDPQSGVLYLYDEYCGLDGDPTVHARQIRNRGGCIPGVIDPAGNGRQLTDGVRLIQMYHDDLDLHLECAENKLLESGILAVQNRMNRGEIKVFSTLTKYLEERRYYRRDDGGHVVTGGDQLQNALRYLVVSGILPMRTMRTKPARIVRDEFADWYRRPSFIPGTAHGWMGR